MASSNQGSLSSVVSGLVRAQMGSTVPQTVNDDDLDRHVADLILKEAKQKAQRYAELGIRAFVAEQAKNAAKTDKRFLTAILRRTDDHNQSVIRAQAEQAAAIKAELEEKERRERRDRAKEATDASRDRMRRLLGGRLGPGSSSSSSSRRDRKEREHRDSDRKRDERRRRRREHDYDYDDAVSDDDSWRERRRRDKSRSNTIIDDRTRHTTTSSRLRDDKPSKSSRRRSSSRSRYTPDVEGSQSSKQRTTPAQPLSDNSEKKGTSRTPPLAESELPRKRRRMDSSRSPSPEGVNTTYHWRRSRSPGDSDTRSERSRRRRSVSPTTLSDDEYGPQLRAAPRRPTERQLSPEPSPEPYEPPRRGRGRVAPAGAGPNMSSKMDRYFETSYDPRLDNTALSVPDIPSTGLLDDADFAGWEAMLDLIKIRREDKAERKWLEKHGLAKEEVSKANKPTAGDSLGLMEIQYKKRGSTREWDMGKEGLD